MSTQPLTEAEAAAALVLSRIHNRRVEIAFELEPGDFADEAAEVVAAIGPLMAIKFYENAADVTEKTGPMSAEGFRALALMARQSLSRPTSEEHR